MIQHYNDSTVATGKHEPIIPSLFEATLIPPTTLSALEWELLRQEIKSVSGFDAFERVPALISQTFGAGTRRLFPGVQVDNVVELNITCNVNLMGDDGTNASILLMLKKLKDLQYNRATGHRGSKATCGFTLIVKRYNKDNTIWGIATMKNCMFGESGITGLDEVNIETDDAAVLSFSVSSDDNSIQYAADTLASLGVIGAEAATS